MKFDGMSDEEKKKFVERTIEEQAKKTGISLEDMKDMQKMARKFREFSERVGLNNTCPSCGDTNDRAFLGIGKSKPVISLSEFGRFYPCYALCCSRCGFVSTYLESRIDEVVGEESDD